MRGGGGGKDGGIDLPVRGGCRTIAVECRHRPEGAAGRPVVQKLRSAALTLTDSGKVMENGRLADDAKCHVRHGMDFRIRLMGGNEIVILAEMAGMRLALKAAALEGGRGRPPPGCPAWPASGWRGAYRAGAARGECALVVWLKINDRVPASDRLYAVALAVAGLTQRSQGPCQGREALMASLAARPITPKQQRPHA